MHIVLFFMAYILHIWGWFFNFSGFAADFCRGESRRAAFPRIKQRAGVNYMDQIVKKSSDASRGLLFGLLVNCLFTGGTNEECPLHDLRTGLTIEEKHKLVMDLTVEEIRRILAQHEICYERQLSKLKTAASIPRNN